MIAKIAAIISVMWLGGYVPFLLWYFPGFWNMSWSPHLLPTYPLAIGRDGDGDGDGDHQFCVSVISKNEEKHVRLEFLRILSFILWWIKKQISQYLKSNLQIVFIHKIFVQLIPYMSIFWQNLIIFHFWSPGLSNCKNSFGGALVRVLRKIGI